MFWFWWMYRGIHQHWSGKVKMTFDHYHPLNQFCVLYYIFYLFKNLNVKNSNSKEKCFVASTNLYLLLLSWQHHSISSTLHHWLVTISSHLTQRWHNIGEKYSDTAMTAGEGGGKCHDPNTMIFNKNIKNMTHVNIWYTLLIWSNRWYWPKTS